jgi:hypothetical protein
MCHRPSIKFVLVTRTDYKVVLDMCPIVLVENRGHWLLAVESAVESAVKLSWSKFNPEQM